MREYREFKENGYDNAVPQIVHWSMPNNSEPTKWMVPSTKPGVTWLENKLLLDSWGG